MYQVQGLILVLWCVSAISGVQIMSLDFPDDIHSGSDLTLRCHYNLEGESLYSVKWYRDDMEFFRFVPRDNPPKQFFPLEGIDVDVSLSDERVVFMRGLKPSTEGLFRCEVSADAPSFQTVSAQKTMIVKVNFNFGKDVGLKDISISFEISYFPSAK
ncbi:uncharacterized protein LOC111087521 isoform X2 [Limulus polyphemus]|uniref:Uncharacterized protein LOC111087521 isoform X2 n=1 Tax=Limulus polyphemus TaxID=6850 RepID=A0ABM1T2N3_LIMPO|nr:uncharacterized protein LOC111087521 isoform X2 [Limulus polyphemus]